MQQINLYLPEFRPNRKPVRAEHMVWAIGALLLLLVLWSFWSALQTQDLAEQVAEEQRQLEQLQQQVQELTARQPRRQGPDLETEIERLQNEIQRRENIRLLITQQNLGNADGFSAQLQALARQSMAELALQHFSLQQGGSYVELSGRVRQAERVPEYLQRLRLEPSFTRVRFGVMDVERDESSDPGLKFSLSKAAAKGAEPNAR